MANHNHLANDIIEGSILGTIGSILFAGFKAGLQDHLMLEVIHGFGTIVFAIIGAIAVYYTNKFLRKRDAENK